MWFPQTQDIALTKMNALQEFNQCMNVVDAGNYTAAQFTHDQVYESTTPIRQAEITKPMVRLNGETVVVSLRSKTGSVIVSIKNTSGVPTQSLPHIYSNYINRALDNAKADLEVLISNLAVKRREGDGKCIFDPSNDPALMEEWNTHWVDQVTTALGKSHSDGGTEPRLFGHACLCLSSAINTLVAQLFLDAMELTESEGMKLCYANRAKIFHAHAKANECYLKHIWGDKMTMKVISV